MSLLKAEIVTELVFRPLTFPSLCCLPRIFRVMILKAHTVGQEKKNCPTCTYTVAADLRLCN